MVFETVVMEGGLEDGITGEVMYQGLEAWAAYDDSGSGEFCMLMPLCAGRGLKRSREGNDA